MTITAITVGLDRYINRPAWNIAEAEVSRATVEKLLVRHGAQPEDWTNRATNDQIRKVLGEWSKRIEDSLVIYWVGHGQYSGDYGYRVALADSNHPLTPQDALTSTDFWQVLRDQSDRRKTIGNEDQWVLLILDTCGSGEGIWDLWRSFDREPENVGVIAAADEGAAFVGRLATTLDHLLQDFDGNDSAGIPLFELMHRIAARIGMRRVRHSFDSFAILPLPSDTPPAVQAPRDIYQELREVLAAAPPEVRNHFYAKAQGSEITEVAWYFAGRESERAEASAWLREAAGGMFVVSGVAGSGKSALVGMLLATSDEDVSDVLANIGEGLIPSELRPIGVRFDAVLHLSGRTLSEAVVALSTALGSGAGEDVEALLQAVASRDGGQLTVLVDALDESRDPLMIATALRRLAGLPGVRVLVGTRQSMHEDPDHPVPLDSAILDALAAERLIKLQREPDAVLRYVKSRLRSARPDLTDEHITDLAKTIARYEQPFLFARLAVSEVIAEPELADSDDLLARVLSSGHSGIFGHAVARLARTAPEVEALLHALTYTRGNGFPRTGGIWALAASELSETSLNDVHVEKALELAAPFIMQDSEFGQGVYRLAHRTFAEWYIRGDAVGECHSKIVSALIGAVKDSSRDVPLNAYIAKYTSAHAAGAGLAGWQAIASKGPFLDRLDQRTVAADIMRSAFGRMELPPAIIATLGASDVLASVPAADRSGVRQIAMAQFANLRRPPTTPDQEGRWSLVWADLIPRTSHLALVSSDDGIVALITVAEFSTRQLLVASTVAGTIRIWDPVTAGIVGNPISAHLGAIRGLTIIPQLNRRPLIASAGDDGAIRLWDLTGQQVGITMRGHRGGVRAVITVEDADGRKLLASGGEDGVIRVWDPVDCQQVTQSDGDIGRISALAAVPGGGRGDVIASGGDDAILRLWDVSTGTQVGFPMAGHTNWIRTITAVVDASGRTLLASGGEDTTVRIWDPRNHSAVGDPLVSATGPVFALAPLTGSSTGVRLATAGVRSIGFIDPDGSNGCWPYRHAGTVSALSVISIAGGRELLASGGDDGAVRVWDPAAGAASPAKKSVDTLGPIASLALPTLASGRTLLASGGQSIRLWDPQSGDVVDRLTTRPNFGVVRALVSINDGDHGAFLAAGGDDGIVQLFWSGSRSWDRPVDSYDCHVGAINVLTTLTVRGGKKFVASGGEDGTIRRWSTTSGEPFGDPITAHRGAVRALARLRDSDDRELLASAGDDGVLRVSNPITGVLARPRISAHTVSITALTSFTTANGETIIASGDCRGILRLWRWPDLTQIGSDVVVHAGRIRELSGLPSEEGCCLLVSAGDDATIKFVDLNTMAVARTLHVGAFAIRAFAVIKDDAFALGFDDGLAVISVRAFDR